MAAEPITLNIRDVALAARRAYDEGRLSAQGPAPVCKYRDGSGRPCAIGAALDDVTAVRLDGELDDDGDLLDTSIASIIKRGRVITDNALALERLQVAHDRWAQAAGHQMGRNADELEQKFVALLDALTGAEA